jgi:hypothetical protein
MIALSSTARRGAAVAAAAFALTLAGCSSEPSVAETVAGQLPDLSEYGYTEFECGTGTTIDDAFIVPEEPYVAHCWKGTQEDPFPWVADDLMTGIIQDTEGINATAQACDEDVLNEAAGIACRAVYVGSEGNDVLVRVIVTLSENPTSEDVIAALAGAELEVLIGTEPIPGPGTSSTASASPAA